MYALLLNELSHHLPLVEENLYEDETLRKFMTNIIGETKPVPIIIPREYDEDEDDDDDDDGDDYDDDEEYRLRRIHPRPASNFPDADDTRIDGPVPEGDGFVQTPDVKEPVPRLTTTLLEDLDAEAADSERRAGDDTGPPLAPSFPLVDLGERREYTGTRMYDRLIAGYGMDVRW